MPAGAKPEPLGYVRKDVQRRGPDKAKWGAGAPGRDRMKALWDRFNQKGQPPRIRFEDRVAVVAGTGGSGSCPMRLHDVRLHPARNRIVVRVYTEAPDDDLCSGDWVPRTFTVSVARRELKPLRPRRLDVRVRRIADPDG